MNRFYLTVILSLATVASLSAQMLVGSYNIRYKANSDSINGNVWQKRCQVLCDQVNFMAPDIFGAQEVLHVQLNDMLADLDGYDYIGVGRDDGKTGGEYAAIFYKTDRLRLLDQGNFWISETPDRPGLGWCLHPHLYMGQICGSDGQQRRGLLFLQPSHGPRGCDCTTRRC